jgi:hypothetical protein
MIDIISSGGTQIITNGLIRWLDAAQKKSYSGSGTTWNDLANGSISGTLVNGAGFNSSNGGSITFDGTNDRANFSDTGLPTGTSSRTMSIWFNFDVMRLQAAISYGTPNVTNSRQNWAIGTNSNRIWMTTEGPQFFFGDTTRTANTWYEATATYDGTNLTRFINGSEVATSNVVTGGTQLNTVLNGTLRIGDYDTVGGLPWDGRVAQVLIYNRALSAAQVAANYNALRLRFGL